MRLEHGVSDSSKVPTPSKENHNPVTNNHYNSSIISERTQNNNTTEKNEIASAILTTPSHPSLTLAGLYSKDRQEQLFICPYCSKFNTLVERKYQHHIVVKHPGKPGYPNMAVA